MRIPKGRCPVIPTKTGSSAAKSRAAHRPIKRRTAIGLYCAPRLFRLAALLIGTVTLPAAYAASATATKSAKTSTETATPAEIDALLSLLADAKVQAWLKQQHATEAAAPAPAKPKDEFP